MSENQKNNTLFALPKNLPSKSPRDYAVMVSNLYAKAYRLTENGYNLMLQGLLMAYEKAGVFGNPVKIISWDEAVEISQCIGPDDICDALKGTDEANAEFLRGVLENEKPLQKYMEGISVIKKEVKNAATNKSDSFSYMPCPHCNSHLMFSIENLNYLECGAANGGYLINFTCSECGWKNSDVYAITKSGLIKGNITIK